MARQTRARGERMKTLRSILVKSVVGKIGNLSVAY
jgi:hypothetical protein